MAASLGSARELSHLDFARFDAKLGQFVAAMTSDLIKWMILFWVGNVATTAGLVFGLAHFRRS